MNPTAFGDPITVYGFRPKPNDSKRVAAVARMLNNTTSSNEIQESHSTLLVLFNNTRVHPYRLIYALAGRLFDTQSPVFGGPTKAQPAYAKFDGSNAEDLLKYIVSETIQSHDKLVVEFVAKCINLVLDGHYRGDKEKIDELMLKGMKKVWFLGVLNLCNPLNLIIYFCGKERQGISLGMASILFLHIYRI
ncbi:hypothetical protein BDR26DRAFT_894446 [Obelidium mucronatum]|nr:hypothetical protein BDR26DRAFT_894446 [Obelidium mucronatum]